MSDVMSCDICGGEGRRRMGRCCPDGWWFAEVRDFDTGKVFMAMACSQPCKERFWRSGPGNLFGAGKRDADLLYPLSSFSSLGDP